MGSDSVQYHYQHLDDGGSSINAAVSRLREVLSTVERQCNPVFSGEDFQGAAQEAYAVRKREWNASADQIAQTLEALQKAVNQASASMQAADKAAAQAFA